MRFGEKFEKEVLNRLVANVQEKFWRKNHMSDNGEDDAGTEERSELTEGTQEGDMKTPAPDEEVEIDM